MSTSSALHTQQKGLALSPATGGTPKLKLCHAPPSPHHHLQKELSHRGEIKDDEDAEGLFLACYRESYHFLMTISLLHGIPGCPLSLYVSGRRDALGGRSVPPHNKCLGHLWKTSFCLTRSIVALSNENLLRRILGKK